jgi:hypothetical protein
LRVIGFGSASASVNYYDPTEKLLNDNHTIGILFCSAKEDMSVEMTLSVDSYIVVASQSMIYACVDRKGWEEAR